MNKWEPSDFVSCTQRGVNYEWMQAGWPCSLCPEKCEIMNERKQGDVLCVHVNVNYEWMGVRWLTAMQSERYELGWSETMDV